MADKKKRTKTNLNVQVDTEVLDQFTGLAKFLKVDRNDLLNEAMKERIEKEKGD